MFSGQYTVNPYIAHRTSRHTHTAPGQGTGPQGKRPLSDNAGSHSSIVLYHVRLDLLRESAHVTCRSSDETSAHPRARCGANRHGSLGAWAAVSTRACQRDGCRGWPRILPRGETHATSYQPAASASASASVGTTVLGWGVTAGAGERRRCHLAHEGLTPREQLLTTFERRSHLPHVGLCDGLKPLEIGRMHAIQLTSLQDEQHRVTSRARHTARARQQTKPAAAKTAA